VLLETDYSSEAFKANINIYIFFTHGFFPAEAIENQGLRFTENLSKFFSPTAQPSTMGTETTKIALNAHVNLRRANQHMSRPERRVDDITDMLRSCRLSENTSGRRPLGSSSRLLKVPNDDDDDDVDDDTPYWGS